MRIFIYILLIVGFIDAFVRYSDECYPKDRYMYMISMIVFMILLICFFLMGV